MSTALEAVPLEGWIEPATAFAALVGDGDGFWLDAGPDTIDGWSWIGPGTSAPDSVAVLATALTGAAHGERLPGPFRGGWVGWVGYEHGADAVGAPVALGDPVPPEAWLRVDRYLAYDHAARMLWAVAPVGEAARWADGLAELGGRSHALPEGDATGAAASQRHRPQEYADLVERCRDAIRAGDAYQLCLTTRFTLPDVTPDALDTYLRLRELVPSHHGGLIRIGSTALISATPERFLEARRGFVRTRPIKGTRPRDSDPVVDAQLAEELRSSPKERAENVMIVDLMRNDLSRVGVPGGIRVESLLEVESYRAVHQLVSTVSARLRGGVTAGELLAASFPAGSMTGAPKLSAMQILHRLEGAPRGLFAGCFGYVGDDGSLDLAMVIRSIVIHPGGAYVGAGGGITWHSVAAREVEEVGWKARAPLAALGARLPPGW